MKNWNGFALSLAALALSGCASLAGHYGVDWANADPGPVPDYEEAQAKATEAILSVLKDPDSAKFRNWTKPMTKTLYKYGFSSGSNYEPLWAICVEVNAKNSFGGYTGFKTRTVKFRNGAPVIDSLGIIEGGYECKTGLENPDRRAPT